MMTVSSTSAVTSATSQATQQKTGFSALGSADFLKLMTVQMQQQDPFNPVDQKEMLAQMAQFSTLSETAEMSATLKTISARLDAIMAGRNAAAADSPSTQEA